MAESMVSDSIDTTPPLECPGPGLLETLAIARTTGSNYLKLIDALQPTYGDLFRIRFGQSQLYVLANPLDIEGVLKTGRDQFAKNPLITREMRSLGPESVAVTDGERWRTHRRITAGPFRPSALQKYQPVLAGALHALRDQWETQNSAIRRVDVDAADFTFRVITQLMMGESLPAYEGRIRKALETEIECLAKRFASPLPIPHWAPTPNQFRLRKAQRELNDAVCEIVDRAARPGTSGFAAEWLRAYQEIESDPNQARSIVRDQLMSMITAGHQTASFGLAYCFYLIARHPDVAERLRSESKRVLGGRAPSLADLEELPYSAWVVRESLRLYPVLPVVLRKVTESFQIRGYHVPQDANLAISIWSAHRHPDFWDEPERFDPERFSPLQSAARQPGAYLPFSLGQRSCLASDFAFYQLQSAVAYLSQFFRFEPDPDWSFEAIPKLALSPKDGISLRVTGDSHR